MRVLHGAEDCDFVKVIFVMWRIHQRGALGQMAGCFLVLCFDLNGRFLNVINQLHVKGSDSSGFFKERPGGW